MMAVTDDGRTARRPARPEAAAEIGEVEEEQRCALFLRQLDPEWSSLGL